eukprot:NODE_350_length_10400_cov_0.385205.p4 type:complete len:315 gc:universal NODE_350_length_10400_cov_0.385205:400-1344(+)
MDPLDFENDFIGQSIIDNDMQQYQRMLPTIVPHEMYYFVCCELGRLEMLKMLPLNFIVLDENNRNMLHYACQFGHIQIVQYLMENEPDLVQSSDNYGDYPFHIACEFGSFAITKFLLMKYPQLLFIDHSDANSGSCLNSILLHRINDESFEIITHMVTNRPDLMQIPRFKQYPIFQLFSIEQSFHFLNKCLTLFLNFNCDLTVKDASGKNILHYALKLNNAELTGEFLKRDVSINEQDADGNSPLHDYYYAAANQSFVERYFSYIPCAINWSLVNKSGDSVEKLKNRAVSISFEPGRKRTVYEEQGSLNKKVTR